MAGDGTRGRLLVAAQFALLALWLLAGPRLASHAVGLLVQAGGLAVAGWAFLVMIVAQRRLFRIAPDPTGHTQLVTWGPYRWVRHPMYLAILMVVGPAWLAFPPDWRAIGFAALVAVLVTKLRHEEHLLAGHFDGYAAYRTKSSRLLPGVY
jgi:protein-S-isoprenylcysteine O-methyltransferase Ste14